LSGRRGRPGLAARLFAAQLLVIVAGCLTLALTAVAIAPGLFRIHARQAFTVLPAGATAHLEQGFEEAMLRALGIAGYGGWWRTWRRSHGPRSGNWACALPRSTRASW
jgi:hypothetical protein